MKNLLNSSHFKLVIASMLGLTIILSFAAYRIHGMKEFDKSKQPINAQDVKALNENLNTQKNEQSKSQPTTTPTQSKPSSSPSVKSALKPSATNNSSNDAAKARAEDFHRCSSIDGTAATDFQILWGNVRTDFDIGERRLSLSRDSGLISISDYDNGMKSLYAQRNASLNSGYNKYLNSVKGQSCTPNIITPPSQLTWNR